MTLILCTKVSKWALWANRKYCCCCVCFIFFFFISSRWISTTLSKIYLYSFFFACFLHSAFISFDIYFWIDSEHLISFLHLLVALGNESVILFYENRNEENNIRSSTREKKNNIQNAFVIPESKQTHECGRKKCFNISIELCFKPDSNERSWHFIQILSLSLTPAHSNQATNSWFNKLLCGKFIAYSKLNHKILEDQINWYWITGFKNLTSFYGTSTLTNFLFFAWILMKTKLWFMELKKKPPRFHSTWHRH